MKKYLLLIFWVCATLVQAQESTTDDEDIKIGLVLSGGGAKGFAHVGVLKVLEEAGIRVDYVAGTSMGAIVGGLYASGYNAREIDSVLNIHDLQGLVRDDLPRAASSFYQKENDGKYALSLPWVKKKIEIPTAVSRGQSAYNVFSQLTEHVHEVNDFSKLPIPFFCVATDLENGEEVVLDHGFLPEAIRASGSYPGLLAPVRIDGKTLVDGGIVDNFPVEKLKAKGVDLIIGVRVSRGLEAVENVNTLPELLAQIGGFQMHSKWEEKVKQCDIFISPDLEEFSTFSFDDSEEIVERGEIAARYKIAELKAAVRRQKSSPERSIKDYDLREEIMIKEIVIKGNQNFTDRYCKKKLGLKEGQLVTREEFVNAIDRLTATGNFESAYYKRVPVEGGSRVEFEIKEDEERTLIQFGAHYDDLYKTGVLVNFTTNHILFKNDVVSADFVVGDNPRYMLHYFYDNGFNWSLGIKSRMNTFGTNITANTLPPVRSGQEFDSTTRIPVEYLDFTTRLYMQTTLGDLWALRVGLEHKFLNVHTDEIIDDEIDRIYFDRSHYFNFFGKMILDTYDSKNFPKRGFYLNADYIFYSYSSDYNDNFSVFSHLYGRFGFAQTLYDKLTFHLISEAGVTLGSNDNGVLDYHLGGYNENYINTFVPFYGYDFAELNESAFLRTALTARYEIFKKNFVSFTANFARINEDIWNDGRIFEDTSSGYAAGYGYNSILGPIELVYSWNPDNDRNIWYINVGFWF